MIKKLNCHNNRLYCYQLCLNYHKSNVSNNRNKVIFEKYKEGISLGLNKHYITIFKIDNQSNNFMKGNLNYDEHQYKIIKLMDRINYYVNNYDFDMANKSYNDKDKDKDKHNNDQKSNDNTNNLNNSNEVKAELKSSVPRLKGLYLYGEVGVGKTLLMDTFYSVCNGIVIHILNIS